VLPDALPLFLLSPCRETKSKIATLINIHVAAWLSPRKVLLLEPATEKEKEDMLRARRDLRSLPSAALFLLCFLGPISAASAVSISGTILNRAGYAVPGVTVTLSGDLSRQTTTDSAGSYSFNFLVFNRNYTVTPAKGKYTFNPASRSFSNLVVSQTADFTGAQFKPSDFDGDQKTDIAVFHRGAGTPGLADWSFLRSSNGTSGSLQWGVSTDTPVPGDFDGDGVTDPAIFRSGTGTNGDWWILRSSEGQIVEEFGFNTDVPLPRDYNARGEVEMGTVRPGTGNLLWFLYDESIEDYCVESWGLSTDKLVPADYDGDGRAEVAVFRPSTGIWYILNQNCPVVTPAPPPDYQAISWGYSTDLPVPGDYDGDGKDDVAVFRPSEGVWYIRKSSDGNLLTITWGLSTDVPVPGDYDGDDKFDAAIFRPSTATWWILKSSDGQSITQQFGASTDTPVPSLYIPH
jgi:hypothetical protein